MHCFMKLPTIAALGALVVASVASPAPAPLAEKQNTKQFTLERPAGKTADTAAQFIGVVDMCTGNQCNGPSTEVWEIYGWPGSYGCLPVPPGWVTESVLFSQGIGNVPGCYATTWSSANCGGPSTRVPVQECLAIPYAAVSVNCAA